MRPTLFFIILALLVGCHIGSSQPAELDKCNIVWTSQSRNSSESMPCGGHDIGLNVWVENGELLFYISRSGSFDENNGFMKLGRVRVKLDPNPLTGNVFRQELVLRKAVLRFRRPVVVIQYRLSYGLMYTARCTHRYHQQ